MTQAEVRAVADSPTTSPRSSHFNAKDLVSALGSPAFFLVTFVVLSTWLGAQFLSSTARMLDFSQSVPVMFIAMGVVVVLTCGQFDLSLAFNTSFIAYFVIGLYTTNELPMGVCIAIALGAGALFGLVSGLLVTHLKMNAFIATLATGGVLEGLSHVYSDGDKTITPGVGTRMLPTWFSNSLGNFQDKVPTAVAVIAAVIVIGALLITVHYKAIPPLTGTRVRAAVLGAVGVGATALLVGSGVLDEMSWNIFCLLVFALIMWTLLGFTTYGRALTAVGSNARAAGYAGIHLRTVTVSAFVLAGVLAAAGGVMLAAAQGAAIVGSANSFLLPAYAAAFLSTVLMSRGRFHIWGSIAGVLCLTYVASGLVAGGVAYTWTSIVNGLVLLAAVALSSALQRQR